MEYLKLLNTFPALLIIGYLGMFCHFLSKKIKGETILEIKNYFKSHFKSTLVAFIATSIGILAYFVGLYTGKLNDPIAAFGIGMTFDSIINKWDK